MVDPSGNLQRARDAGSAPAALARSRNAPWICAQPDHQALIFMGAVVDIVHKGPDGEDLGTERLDWVRCFF